MAMAVETFEVLETMDNGQEECSIETINLIEKLGLEGQQKLLSGDDEKQLCPYRKMTKEEQTVYEAICSKACKINEYSDGAIPLRVLQVYEHAVSLDMFKEFRVLYCPNADIEDPVLIALRDEGNVTARYILARWGEALEPFSKMREIASRLLRNQAKQKIIQIENELELKKRELDCCTDDMFVDGTYKNPYFSSSW